MAEIAIPLRPIPDGQDRPVISDEGKAKILALVAEDEDERDWFSWDAGHWGNLPFRYYEALSEEDVVRLWFSSMFHTNVTEYTRKNTRYELIEKIRLAMFYYFAGESWNDLVDYYHRICSFDFGEPHFEVKVDFPWALQGFGTAQRMPSTPNAPGKGLWLDGAIGFHLFYKGAAVGLISFSPSRVGVLIQQAQANVPHGNRWMYRLPGKFLDVVVDKIADHFDRPVWIVDGRTQAEYIRKVSNHKEVTFETLLRIANTYDAEIKGWRRTSEVFKTSFHAQTGARIYHRLERT